MQKRIFESYRDFGNSGYRYRPSDDNFMNTINYFAEQVLNYEVLGIPIPKWPEHFSGKAFETHRKFYHRLTQDYKQGLVTYQFDFQDDEGNSITQLEYLKLNHPELNLQTNSTEEV